MQREHFMRTAHCDSLSRHSASLNAAVMRLTALDIQEPDAYLLIRSRIPETLILPDNAADAIYTGTASKRMNSRLNGRDYICNEGPSATSLRSQPDQDTFC